AASYSSPPLGGALDQIGGETVAPRGKRNCVLSLALEGGIGGAWCGASEHVRGGREDPALDFCLVGDLAGAVVPGTGFGRGHVVNAELDALDQADDSVGEVPSVGRRANLVANDQHLALGRRQTEHRLDEVRASDPKEPGGADDEVSFVCRRRRFLTGE